MDPNILHPYFGFPDDRPALVSGTSSSLFGVFSVVKGQLSGSVFHTFLLKANGVWWCLGGFKLMEMNVASLFFPGRKHFFHCNNITNDSKNVPTLNVTKDSLLSNPTNLPWEEQHHIYLLIKNHQHSWVRSVNIPHRSVFCNWHRFLYWRERLFRKLKLVIGKPRC